MTDVGARGSGLLEAGIHGPRAHVHRYLLVLVEQIALGFRGRLAAGARRGQGEMAALDGAVQEYRADLGVRYLVEVNQILLRIRLSQYR